jgi:hypothetical protein
VPSILEALRDHLITQNIARSPRVAGPKPPLWLAPQNGIPAAGEGTNATEVGDPAVLALFLAPGIASSPFEAWMERPIVDVWARTRTSPQALDLLHAVRGAVIGVTPEPAVGFVMGGLTVIGAQEWRPIQPVLPTAAGTGWTYTWSALFQVYTV